LSRSAAWWPARGAVSRRRSASSDTR
jgi:hypothetical protein